MERVEAGLRFEETDRIETSVWECLVPEKKRLQLEFVQD